MNVGLPQLVLLPPIVLLVSGVALFNFQNLFRFLSTGTPIVSRSGVVTQANSSIDAHLLFLMLGLSLCLSICAGLKDYMTIPIVQSLRPCAFSILQACACPYVVVTPSWLLMFG